MISEASIISPADRRIAERIDELHTRCFHLAEEAHPRWGSPAPEAITDLADTWALIRELEAMRLDLLLAHLDQEPATDTPTD